MVRKLVIFSTLFGLALASLPAEAQFSRYALPVEKGVLENKLEVQYQYSKLGDVNTSIMSVEGQYVLSDRLELGLNVPFLTHDYGTQDGFEFGDVILSAKLKVLGVGDMLGLALFLNGALPTHSSDLPRDNSKLQGGAAVNAALLGFTVGGDVQLIWGLDGSTDDQIYLGVNAFARMPIIPLIAIQLAAEYYQSFKPSSDINALVLTPGLEFSFLGVNAGIAARIATTDDAKILFASRLGVLAHGGFRF
ncbi:MAG: transporter [Deltaproteobacteria bacterium]|nr:transporter [Deltaproteobacteria bacterium]